MSDRLVQLESKIAMLEHTVDVLGGELAAHQQAIDRLQQDMKALTQHLKQTRGAESNEPTEPHNTPPPHWGGSS